MGNFLAEEANLRLLFGADALSPTPRIRELIGGAIPLQSLSRLTGLPESLLSEIAFALLKENFDKLYAEIGPTIRARLNAVASNARETIREGHNRALDKNLDSERQAGILSELSWLVLDAPEGGVILPDCVALGIEQGSSDALPYMMTDNERLACVLMPLSSVKLLIGRCPGTALPVLRSFNASAAACSREFFVSASNLQDGVSLVGRIGERCQALFADVTSDVLRDLRADWLPACRDVPPVRASFTMPNLGETVAVDKPPTELCG